MFRFGRYASKAARSSARAASDAGSPTTTTSTVPRASRSSAHAVCPIPNGFSIAGPSSGASCSSATSL